MKITLESHNTWRENVQRNALVGDSTIPDVPTLVQRSKSTSTCKSGDNSGVCEKPTTSTSSSNSLTIGLAVAIPVAAIAVILFFLHRRVSRKTREEDVKDKYKSLDFGLDAVPSGRGNKMVPEMTVTDVEKSMRGGRGLSMDGLNNPYLLPAVANKSGDSARTLSRSMQDEADPYRPVTFIRSDSDEGNSMPRITKTYTGSSEPSDESLDAGLLSNASRMSRSEPYVVDSPDSDKSHQFPPPAHVNKAVDQPRMSFAASAVPRSKAAPPTLSLPQVENGAFHVTPPSPLEPIPAPAPRQQAAAPAPPQHVTPPSPPEHMTAPAPPQHVNVTITAPAEQGLRAGASAQRLSVMGLRPLPPDDPLDNPEQRANRIRSFYKEYFDDSKPNPPGQYPRPQFQQPNSHAQHQYQNSYEADIHQDYDNYMYDAPPAPFAEPMGRRAMTPPPRFGGPGRVRSNTSFGSTGHIANPAFRPQQKPKKNLPPPMDLTTLPTPHAMTDDMAFTPIDFAPPISYRDRQAGRRPDSPSMPYSPVVRAHTPLVTSFDDLSVLPSAHALRMSSTFTTLDFAPPPRFRNEGPASDAGSIRSNRSGISNVHSNNIRNGAYRVSRLPTDVVGTQDDIASALKPTWDMGHK